MAQASTVEYTDKVTGSGSEFSNVWFPSEDTSDGFVSIGPDDTAGFIMDFSSLQDTDSLGRQRERLGIVPYSVTLYVKSIAGSVDIGSLRLFSVAQRTVTDFSNDNLPSDVSPNLIEVSKKTNVDVSELSAGDGITFTFGYSDDSVDTTFNSNWNKVIAGFRRADSDSRIVFVLVDSSALSDANITFHAEGSSFPPLISATVWPFHTGHNKAKPGDRAVHCQRTGRPVGAGDLSEDNYQEGVWVVSDALDPTDSRRNPPEFSDTEGDRLDEVPD